MPEQRPLVSNLAEAEVLGEALQYPEAVPQLIETLTSAMFASPAHGFVFEAIAELFKRGSAVDVVTVTEVLKGKGRGQECDAVLLGNLLDWRTPRGTCRRSRRDCAGSPRTPPDPRCLRRDGERSAGALCENPR